METPGVTYQEALYQGASQLIEKQADVKALLEGSSPKMVIVGSFFNLNQNPHPLVPLLTALLPVYIRAVSERIQVTTRWQVQSILNANEWEWDVFFNSNRRQEVMSALGGDILVSGSIEDKEYGFAVMIRAWDMQLQKAIGATTIHIQRDESLDLLLELSKQPSQKMDQIVPIQPIIGIHQLSELYIQLGHLYFEKRQYSQSVEAYKRGEQAGVSSPFLFYMLGYLYETQFEKYIKANQYYSKAKALASGSLLYQINLHICQVLSNQGRFDEANALLKEIQQHDTVDALFYVTQGQLFLTQNQWNESERAFQHALEYDDQLIDAYLGLGKVYIEKEDWERAEEVLVRVNEIDAKHPETTGLLGLIAMKRDQPMRALDYLSHSLQMKPDQPERLYLRATIYAERNELHLAIIDLNNALRINPDLTKGYQLRARLLEEVGHIKDAIMDYTQVVLLLPDDPTAYYRRGSLFLQQEHWEAAIADFFVAKKLEPENPIHYLNRGIGFYHIGNYVDAKEELTAALNLDDTLADAYYYLGLVSLELELYQDAYTQFRQAVELDPTNRDARRRMEALDFQRE